MNMKKLIPMALALALTLSLVGCGKDTPPATQSPGTAPSTATVPEGGKAAADITIAGIVFADDQFMQMLTNGYKDAAEKYGVKLLTANSNSDQAKESELINTYVAQGADGIVIAPLDPNTSVATLKAASDQGMKVCITNMDISDADFIVGGFTSDDYSNAYALGEAASKRLLEVFGDETIIMGVLNYADQFPTQSATRQKGYFDALDAAGVNYTIVAEAAGSTVEMAQQAAGDMMTAHPDIQSIYTCNGIGYIGAYSSFSASGITGGKVVVYGYDANDQTTDWLFDGTNIVWGEVAQDPYTMGYEAMELMIKNLMGEDTSEYAGKTTIVPGAVLLNDDLEGVNKWRLSMGYPEVTVKG